MNTDHSKPAYFDYNASTPLDPEVVSAMQPYLKDIYGNASSTHWYGMQTKTGVEKARQQVADMLNCDPHEVVFTSGGTESNNFSILGASNLYRHKGNHIITSQIEHPAVIEVCKYLETKGFEVTYLPVNNYGMIEITKLEKAIRHDTILISIMHANNEVGTIQPIEAISEISKKNGIIFHTDAAQSVAKIPVDVKKLGVDLLSVAGHKLYAPQGIGALYIREGIELPPLMHGAGHEGGRRPGTENVLEIVGLGKACETGKKNLDINMAHMKRMADKLWEKLNHSGLEIRLNGHPTERLPNTLSISFKNTDAQSLIHQISHEIAVSAGSACHADEVKVSEVLKAMSIPFDWAMGTLRISVGRPTTEEEVEIAAEVISSSIHKMNHSSL